VKFGIQEDVGLKNCVLIFQSRKFWVKYPAEIAVNYALGVDVFDTLGDFQYL